MQCSLTVQIGRLIWLAILDILNVEPIVGLEDGFQSDEEGAWTKPWDGPLIGPDQVGISRIEFH